MEECRTSLEIEVISDLEEQPSSKFSLIDEDDSNLVISFKTECPDHPELDSDKANKDKLTNRLLSDYIAMNNLVGQSPATKQDYGTRLFTSYGGAIKPIQKVLRHCNIDDDIIDKVVTASIPAQNNMIQAGFAYICFY